MSHSEIMWVGLREAFKEPGTDVVQMWERPWECVDANRNLEKTSQLVEERIKKQPA